MGYFIFICTLALVVATIAGLIPIIMWTAESRLRKAVKEAEVNLAIVPADGAAQGSSKDERRMAAFTRLAFTFALVTGTQWLASFIRTPIFQEYVGVYEEANAKLYALYVTIPIVLVYNFAIGVLRPQNLVRSLCFIYGVVLIVLSLYLAYLDSWGGKYGLYVFDGEGAGAISSTLFGESVRTKMFYFLVIVTETRSVVLYGSLMSFLTLYMGTRSKNLGVSVFTFMNFWQQIGMVVFLLSGAAVKFLQIPIGEEVPTENPGEKVAGYRVNGSTVLLFLIALCTLIIPFIATPAYDVLEEVKAEEEAEDTDMPESAKLGSLRSADSAPASITQGPGSGSGIRSNASVSESRMSQKSDAQQARASAAQAMGYDDDDDYLDGDDDDDEDGASKPLLGKRAVAPAEGSRTATQMEMKKVDTPPPGTSPPASKETSPAIDGLLGQVGNSPKLRQAQATKAIHQPETVVPFQPGETNLPPHVKQALKKRRGMQDAEDVDNDRKSSVAQKKKKKSAAAGSGSEPRPDSAWTLLKKSCWECIEGLLLLLSYRFIFLLFIVQYAHLPIRQLIEIQMAFLLGTMYSEDPDTGMAVQPQQSHKSDDKLTLLTVLGLVAGVMNAGLNWAITKDLVSRWGNRSTLMLNPLFATLCLLAFSLSYIIMVRDGFASVSFVQPPKSDWCSFDWCSKGSGTENWHAIPRTIVSWNDDAYYAGWSGNVLTNPSKVYHLCEGNAGLFVLEHKKGGKTCSDESVTADFETQNTVKGIVGPALQGKDSATSALFVYNWKENLDVDVSGKDSESVKLFSGTAQNPVARYHAFIPKKGSKGASKTWLEKRSKSTATAEGLTQQQCKATCVENWRECKHMYWVPTSQVQKNGQAAEGTTGAQAPDAGENGYCTLFTKMLQSESKSRSGESNTQTVLGGKVDAKSSIIRGKRSFADVTKAVQDELGTTIQNSKTVTKPVDATSTANAGIVFVVERRIDQVSTVGSDGKEVQDLNMLTAVVESKDYYKNGQVINGIKREGGNSTGTCAGCWPSRLMLSPTMRYFLVAVFWVLWSSVTFAVCNPIINVITLRTAPKVKVKAKSWSNSFGNNMLKMIGYMANSMNLPVFMLTGTVAGF